MAGKYKISPDLGYLKKRPIRLNYTVVAGGNLDDIQLYDLIYDDIDLKIRKLDIEDNIKYLKEVQK